MRRVRDPKKSGVCRLHMGWVWARGQRRVWTFNVGQIHAFRMGWTWLFWIGWVDALRTKCALGMRGFGWLKTGRVLWLHMWWSFPFGTRWIFHPHWGGVCAFAVGWAMWARALRVWWIRALEVVETGGVNASYVRVRSHPSPTGFLFLNFR